MYILTFTGNNDCGVQLSPLGQLGHKAHTAVTNGECVDDETVVELIANEMRTFPDESGFILENFPVTLDQVFVSLLHRVQVCLSLRPMILLVPSPGCCGDT